MKIRWADMIAPGLVTAVFTVLLVQWLGTGPRSDLQARVPGLDQPSSAAAGPVQPQFPPVAGQPQRSGGQPADIAGSWPWFRGPDLDGVCRDTTPLARQWPPAGPPLLWSIELGEGYASAAIDDGCVYVLDYDEQASADTMRCLSLEDGREIWHNSYPVLATRNHGITRTVPAVVGDCVISLGPRCHVACWDRKTGTCNWLIDLALEHGAIVPRWYAGQCPLVDQDRLILAPCGPALLLAVDYETGEVIWESPNPRAWEMTHSSIVPMQFQGRRLYVYYGSGGVAGVAADDGSLLWDRTDWPSQFATSPAPVALPEGRIFLSSGYGNAIGAQILQLNSQDGQMVTEKVVELRPRQFNSEQQTPILFDRHLYGVRKHGGGPLVCLGLDGQPKWDSGKDRFGHGPYLIADGLLFAMNNTGRLTMAEATPDAYRQLGQCQVIADAHDAWGPMALVAGRLIVRDMTRMVCLDVAEHEGMTRGSTNQ